MVHLAGDNRARWLDPGDGKELPKGPLSTQLTTEKLVAATRRVLTSKCPVSGYLQVRTELEAGIPYPHRVEQRGGQATRCRKRGTAGSRRSICASRRERSRPSRVVVSRCALHPTCMCAAGVSGCKNDASSALSRCTNAGSSRRAGGTSNRASKIDLPPPDRKASRGRAREDGPPPLKGTVAELDLPGWRSRWPSCWPLGRCRGQGAPLYSAR